MRRSRYPAPSEGPDLIPFMNLTTMLIPLLLMGATLAQVSVIDSSLPSIGEIKHCGDTCGEPPLNLTVFITEEGFSIKNADEVLSVEEDGPYQVPCADGCAPKDYNYKELTHALALVKGEHPDEQDLILVPESRVPYEVIISAMDAARYDVDAVELFPNVVIAGGAG